MSLLTDLEGGIVIAEILKYTALVISGLGAGWLGTLLKIGPERRKYNADLFRSGFDSAVILNEKTQQLYDKAHQRLEDLLEPYVEQIANLRKELHIAEEARKTARAENDEMRRELSAARVEIASLRHEIANFSI